MGTYGYLWIATGLSQNSRHRPFLTNPMASTCPRAVALVVDGLTIPKAQGHCNSLPIVDRSNSGFP